jgi:hypothetical protein
LIDQNAVDRLRPVFGAGGTEARGFLTPDRQGRVYLLGLTYTADQVPTFTHNEPEEIPTDASRQLRDLTKEHHHAPPPTGRAVDYRSCYHAPRPQCSTRPTKY